MESYDLIVVGGGFAGTAAAIAAARKGLRVLLIEKGNCFGGAAVQSLVNPFMGYSTVDPKTKERLYLSNGIFKEILEGLRSFAHWQTTARCSTRSI